MQLIIHTQVLYCQGFNWSHGTEVSVCVCVAPANRRKSLYHLGDLNSVSSCTVVISRALQGSKDQCSWCLLPPWKKAHYSSSLYQQAPKASVTPFPIPDLWLQSSCVSLLHMLTVTHTRAHTLDHTKPTRHKLSLTWAQPAAPEVAKPVFKGAFITLTVPLSPAD